MSGTSELPSFPCAVPRGGSEPGGKIPGSAPGRKDVSLLAHRGAESGIDSAEVDIKIWHLSPLLYNCAIRDVLGQQTSRDRICRSNVTLKSDDQD